MENEDQMWELLKNFFFLNRFLRVGPTESEISKQYGEAAFLQSRSYVISLKFKNQCSGFLILEIII